MSMTGRVERRRSRSSWARIALSGGLAAVLLAGACDEESKEEEPSLLRVRFESEMKAILRDIKAAEEMAAISEGRYLELDELRSRYLSREIPGSYEISLTDVSGAGFRAEILHGATGLRCVLVAGGGGAPTCR